MGRAKAYNLNNPRLKQAVQFIRNGVSYNRASQITQIASATIRKYYTKYRLHETLKESESSGKDKFSADCDENEIFNPDQENALKKTFKQFESLYYGLSEKECRMLAYQMVVKEDLKIPEGWNHGMAAVDWLLSFKHRHRKLKIQKPVRCSTSNIGRNIVWEKSIVNNFYDDLETLLQKDSLKDGTRIFSLDETFTSLDLVNKVMFREHKWDLITTCCIINASGISLPPVIITPHRYLDRNNYSAIQPGAISLTASHGRLTSDLFPEIMQHFVKHSNSSPENPSILIMDIDLCHLSSAALDLVETSGVHVLTLHPHISKQLQPLEGGLFDLYRNYYYQSMEVSMEEHKESKETKSAGLDYGKIIGEAYRKTMTPENIQNAFKKCGILPFDRDLFSDSDYMSYEAVEQPCFVCKARDDRSKKPTVQTPGAEVPNANVAETSKDVVDLKASENAASSASPKRNQTAQSDGTEMSQQQRGAELDKLKRRMIRTVARLLKEKKTEDEVWKELKKESGTNCKTLWERMRSLTLKKLKRLLDAEDRVDIVPSVARMTLTDWLLYDLVIVHEKIDVIDRKQTKDNEVLKNLFSLVQRFAIEGRCGDDLANAWTAATISYNSTGHQCSPMLMQRRWYQLKELTRHKLYKFWFNYRGNERLLQAAKQDPPTELQKAIALRFPEIITQPFPEWEERIERKLVIMPEEFEVKMRKKMPLMKSSDENAPDVVIVEEKIDTITLRDSDSEYSDEENSRESNATPQNADSNTGNDETSQTPIIVNVKTEPEDDYIENIDITDNLPYQSQLEEPKDRFQEEIERLRIEEDRVLTDKLQLTEQTTEIPQFDSQDYMMPLITNVMGAVTGEIDCTTQNDISIENENDIANVVETADSETECIIHNDEELDITDNQSNEANDIGETETIRNDQPTDNEESKVIKNNSHRSINNKAEEATQSTKPINNEELDIIENRFDTQSQESILIDDDDEIIPVKEENNSLETSEIGNKDVAYCISEAEITSDMQMNVNTENAVDNDNTVPAHDSIEIDSPTNSNHHPIPLVNDASDIVQKMEIDSDISEDDEENINENITHKHHGLKDCAFSPVGEFDENVIKVEPTTESHNLDFMDEVISEMNFADDGIEFVDDGIEYNEEGQNISNVVPVAQETENEGNPKFDLKLLLNPVVYTTKLDEMIAYKNRQLFDTIDGKELVDKIILESKPISTKSINVEQVVEQVKADEHEIKEDDNGVHIKVENQEVNEVDDDLFHSDSSHEFDSDVIDDSKKVKLSSTLLQKPRVRSYHPIQLCKNPDFNTRLKRLTVGFFSYSRNRAFLKVCKPMTIDLSKTFESKLIDGTMYLKPSDQSIKKEVENVTESTVSVLPSTVAVQSLMDNETADVDKILQEELKKRILERNKIITLPHISVVRQINQQLLMAEVSPIMATAGIFHHDNAGNNQQNINTVEKENENNDASRLKPDSNVEVTKSLNDFKSKNSMLLSMLASKDKRVLSNETRTKEQETEKCANNVSSDVAKQSDPVLDNNENNKSKVDRDKDKQKKKQERQKYSNVPSWITKSTYDTKLNDYSDSLLTIDTLYKMLSALDPTCVKPLPVKTKKKKVSAINKQREKTKPKTAPVLTSDYNSTCKSKKRCCWSKLKMEKISGTAPFARLHKHKCVTGNCKCCCKELLRQLEIDIEVKILERMQNSSENLSETIEHVVQQSHDTPNVTEPESVLELNADTNAVCASSQIPVKVSIDVGLQADMDKYDSVDVVSNEVEVTKLPTHIKQKLDVANNPETEIINIDEEESNVPLSTEIQSPKPKIRIYSGISGSQTNIPYIGQRKKMTRTQPRTMSPNVVPNMTVQPLTLSVTPKIVPLNNKVQVYTKDDEDDSNLPCSCRPNVVVDQSSAMLVVDGSNECRRHTRARVSKETRIYINRKHMSSTERPFYVGKNKILLTNVKQPKPQPPPSDLITLPHGVQVVLLPDGTITYLVDPNVHLTSDQIAAMPSILCVIQSQIKAAGITLPVDDVSMQEIGDKNNIDDGAVSEPVDKTCKVQNLESDNIEDQQNKENNKINEEAPSTEPLDSVVNLEEDSITTSCVNGQSDLPNEINLAISSKHAGTDTEVVKNVTEEENKLSTPEMLVNKESPDPDSIRTKKVSSETELSLTVNPDDPVVIENQRDHAEKNSDKNGAVASSETVDRNNASASRNLLSDLMEMSGILEEDIAPVQHELEERSNMTLSESIMQPLTLQTSELSIPQPLLPVQIPPSSPLENRKHSISARVNEKTYELNPITSFTELKYACENDGLFFKLDLNNGIIVPINVCIQKTTPGPAISKTNVDPAEVIDLTDEQGVLLNEQDDNNIKLSEAYQTTPDIVEMSSKITSKKIPLELSSKIAPRKLTSMMPIPAHDKNSLLKIKSTSLLRIATDEEKKQARLNRLSNNLKPLKILRTNQHINILRKKLLVGVKYLKRAANLSKAEARINFVDSNAPMQEEYIVDDSSEDSDDEPLAKVAKRMRDLEDKDNNRESELIPSNTQESQDQSVSQEEIALLNDQNIDFEDAIDAVEPPVPLDIDSEITRPVPTQLVLSGDALNQPLLLNDSFLVSNDADDEDSQEDCILGV